MKWSRLLFSVCLSVVACRAMANDSIRVVPDDTLRLSPKSESRYERHVQKAQRRWASLIPRQFVIQNAGNMGLLSAGIGWEYGKRKQWETHLLIGFIPKHQSSRVKMTMTLKENYIPWSIDLKKGWSMKPLSASIYVNTIYGHEFWKTQPGRYPDKYYEFMSTKFRLNIAIGQQFAWQIPYKKRRTAKSVSLFYEVSSCDLYIRSKFIDHTVPLKDIIGLSLGVKLQAF